MRLYVPCLRNALGQDAGEFPSSDIKSYSHMASGQSSLSCCSLHLQPWGKELGETRQPVPKEMPPVLEGLGGTILHSPQHQGLSFAAMN